MSLQSRSHFPPSLRLLHNLLQNTHQNIHPLLVSRCPLPQRHSKGRQFQALSHFLRMYHCLVLSTRPNLCPVSISYSLFLNTCTCRQINCYSTELRLMPKWLSLSGLFLCIFLHNNIFVINGSLYFPFHSSLTFIFSFSVF